MRRIALLASLTSVTLAACATRQPEAPPPPDTIVRLDTIIVTREVEPPLPDGRLTSVCLANGQSAEIRISEAGDTLIGPRRVALQDLGPAIGFVGSYASGKAWFVDDEPIVGVRLKPALEKNGYRVEACEDGEQALARIAEEAFDIVVTDIRMEPIDGIKVLGAALEKNPRTKVIIITGLGDPDGARLGRADARRVGPAAPFVCAGLDPAIKGTGPDAGCPDRVRA